MPYRDEPNRGLDACLTDFKRMIFTLRTNIDTQASLAGVDTVIDLVLVCAVHGLRSLYLAIRARGTRGFPSNALKSFVTLTLVTGYYRS